MTSKYDTEDYELEFIINLKRISPMEECPNCHGKGTTPDDYYYLQTYNGVCNECYGAGKCYTKLPSPKPTIPQSLIDDLKVAWITHNFENYQQSPNICEECNGTGDYEDPQTRFETTIECPFCNGIGER